MVPQNADLNQRIWQVVAQIPPGKVATYGDVADHAGLPGAARRVGRALRGLPGDTRIPWHRVINAQGRLSLPEGGQAWRTQKERLQSEGLTFDSGKIRNLYSVRWNPLKD